METTVVEGPSTPETDLIVKFYTSFQKLDAEGMCSCYTDDVEFSDSVFVDLKGIKAHAM